MSEDPPGPRLPNKLKELALAERPQERLQRYGPASMSDSELLAMILRNGTQGQDVLTLATRLIAEAGSLAGLITWRETDFRKLKGIGHVKALQLITMMEIARRVLGQQTGEAPLLHSPELVAAHLKPIAAGLEVEKFWVLCLNRKNRLIKRLEVTSGTANNTLVHPREVYREAIREGASAIVCVHNHPSGDPAPSVADLTMTKLLREASKIVQIELIDHVILGRPEADPIGLGFYSFREGGVI